MSQTTEIALNAFVESALSIIDTMFLYAAEKDEWREGPEYFGIARILLDSGLT